MKMKENVAGSYIPRRFAFDIEDEIHKRNLDPEFVEGAAVVLSYLSCPKDADMRGTAFGEFLDNALAVKELHEITDELAESMARKVIDHLESIGVAVVDAQAERGDR